MSLFINQEPNDISAVRNPVPVVLTAPANWRSIANYEVRCYILAEQGYRSDAWYIYLDFPVKPDQDNRIVLDLGPTLEEFLQPEPPTQLASFGGKVATKMAARYQVIFRDFSGSTYLSLAAVNGVKHIVRAGFSEYKGQVLESHINQGLFLSDQPRVKRSTPDQPEWLAFGMPMSASSGTVGLKAALLFESGAESSEIGGPQVTCEPGDILLLTTGYNQNLLGQTPAGEPIVGYKMWLDKGGSPISEVQEYRFDHKLYCNPQARYVVFENQMGTYDSVLCRGEAQGFREVESLGAERISTVLRGQAERMLLTLNSRNRQSQRLSVGLSTEEEQDWLNHLLASEDVYRVGESPRPNRYAEGELIPMNISPGRTKISDDGDFLHRLEFELEEAIYHRGL